MKPITRSTTQTTAKAAAEPPAKHNGKPAHRPVTRSMTQSAIDAAVQPAAESLTKPVKAEANKPGRKRKAATAAAVKPNGERTKRRKLVSKGKSKRSGDPTGEPVNGSIARSTTDSTAKPAAELVIERPKKPTKADADKPSRKRKAAPAEANKVESDTPKRRKLEPKTESKKSGETAGKPTNRPATRSMTRSAAKLTGEPVVEPTTQSTKVEADKPGKKRKAALAEATKDESDSTKRRKTAPEGRDKEYGDPARTEVDNSAEAAPAGAEDVQEPARTEDNKAPEAAPNEVDDFQEPARTKDNNATEGAPDEVNNVQEPARGEANSSTEAAPAKVNSVQEPAQDTAGSKDKADETPEEEEAAKEAKGVDDPVAKPKPKPKPFFPKPRLSTNGRIRGESSAMGAEGRYGASTNFAEPDSEPDLSFSDMEFGSGEDTEMANSEEEWSEEE